MLLRFLCNLMLVCGFIAAVAEPLPADELRDMVGTFLETGGTRSAENLSAAESQYLRLRERAPADGRVDYACAIVLLNQRKYANALPLLARQVSQHPTDVEAGCWYVWTLVQCRRYREGLSAVGALASRLANPTLAVEAARLEATHTLGRILGYYERLRPGGIAPEEITTVKNELLATLPAELLEKLDAGAAQTAAEFSELLTAREQRAEERLASTEKSKGSVAASLEQQTSQVEHSEAERDALAEQAHEAARKWSVLQRQIASLSQDRAQVSAQMLAIQTMLQQLSRTIDGGTTGQGSVVTRFTQQQVSIEDAARAQQLALQLASLNKMAFDMDRKLLAYGTEAEKLRSEGTAQRKAAMRNEELRQEAARRAEALDKRLLQLERNQPAQMGLVTMRMRSLSTYLPFDYEAESLRVLGWFRDSP